MELKENTISDDARDMVLGFHAIFKEYATFEDAT